MVLSKTARSADAYSQSMEDLSLAHYFHSEVSSRSVSYTDFAKLSDGYMEEKENLALDCMLEMHVAGNGVEKSTFKTCDLIYVRY